MKTNFLNIVGTGYNPINAKPENPKNNLITARLTLLKRDTVNFSGKNKKDALGAPGHYALEIIQKAEHTYPEFEAMAKRVLGESFEKAGVKDFTSSKSKLKKEGVNLTTKKALDSTTDLLRARGITDGSKSSITNIIENLTKEIEQGNCVVTEIRNYRGIVSDGKEGEITPYLTGEHVSQIFKAQTDAGAGNFSVSASEGVGKTSKGYTAAHILGKIKGLPFEFQIKGRMVKYIDDGTHLLHDLKKGKTIHVRDKELEEVQKLYKELPKEVAKQYERTYIPRVYQAARNAELTGEKMRFPTLPRQVPFELSLPYLIQLARGLGVT